MELRKDPALGVDDFKAVKEESYYVDKTSLIKYIVSKTTSTSFLFTRPRRFGKSLALSMLKAFFEMDEEDKAPLFEGTRIYGEKEIVEGYFMQYPVVYLNFKNAIGENKEYLLSTTRQCLKEEYGRHRYLRNSPALDDFEKTYIEDLLHDRLSEAALSSSIANLIAFLKRHHGKRVVVLIDEYDTPIRYAHDYGFYKDVINLYKGLYGAALKSNADILYAVLTGILQISKESIFSGLNNLVVNTVLDSGAEEGFGFTEEEVDALLKSYGLLEKKDEFKEWYDGYRFGRQRIYNPLSLLSAVAKGETGPYWTNTSEKSSLFELLNDSSLLPYIGNLLGSGEIESDVDLSISYLDIRGTPEYLASFLLATGYLTAEERLGGSRYRLRIPNREIKAVFEKEIVRRYIKEDGNDLAKRLSVALQKADAAEIRYLFETHILTNLSYYELNEEKHYQIMMASALSLVLRNYKIRTEVNSGLGRGDIIAFPNDLKEPGYIFEIKWLKGKTARSRLKASSEKALAQIEDRNYINEFSNTPVSNVVEIGIAFSLRDCEAAAKTVTRG